MQNGKRTVQVNWNLELYQNSRQNCEGIVSQKLVKKQGKLTIIII